MSEAEEVKTATKEQDEGSPPSQTQPDDQVESDQNVTGNDDENVGDEEEKDEGKIDVKEESNEKNMKQMEKQEEAKLRARYPDMKTHVASSFLQKRLSKGNKYFDSGDYNMAKAKVGAAKPVIGPGQKVVLPGPTGDAIPTPETVPHKKITNIQSKLVNTHLS